MNLLFVANKPRFISSNKFLSILKRKYNIKKMGFSGTLDPFADGVLVIASNQFTKLFRFLKKTPKVYQTTIMLGAFSKTLDIEKIETIEYLPKFNLSEIEDVLKSFLGKQYQYPPKYSAKKIEGRRAYKLDMDDVYLEKLIEIEIFDIKLIDYSHPFLTIEVSVSEGTYIRSLGFDIGRKLNVDASLITLTRIKEGEFIYNCEKPLNVLDYLSTINNKYQGDIFDIIYGKKLNIDYFEKKDDGIYHIVIDNYLTIIEIKNREVKYLLNKIKLKD